MNWVMIRALLASVADTAIVPLQDVLGLGREARMNRPATLGGNWAWRFREDALDRRARARPRDARAPLRPRPVTDVTRERNVRTPSSSDTSKDRKREHERDEERAQEPDAVGAHHHDEPDAT